MSFRLCWALCSHQVPLSCSTCAGMCFGSWERLAHWDHSQNLCFSFPFSFCSKPEGFYTARPNAPSRSHGRMEPWKNVMPAQCVPTSAHQTLAWPGQIHRHGAQVVAGATSRQLLAVISLAGALCEECRPLRPPGSEGWFPHHTAHRSHWLWRGFFTSSSSSTFFCSRRAFTLLHYRKYAEVPLAFTGLRISFSSLRFMT